MLKMSCDQNLMKMSMPMQRGQVISKVSSECIFLRRMDLGWVWGQHAVRLQVTINLSQFHYHRIITTYNMAMINFDKFHHLHCQGLKIIFKLLQ